MPPDPQTADPQTADPQTADPQAGIFEAPPCGLTAVQRDVLLALHEMTEGGVPPSYRELCAELGITSLANIVRIIGLLEARGFVRRRKRSARSLVVVAPLPPPPEPEFVGFFEAPALLRAAGLVPGACPGGGAAECSCVGAP